MRRRSVSVGVLAGVLAAVVVALAVVVVVRGGETPRQARTVAERAQVRADRLWTSRTPYVGSSSSVTALASSAGFAEAGAYTLALETGARPYGVTVGYTGSPSVTEAGMRSAAFLLLGTVSNLDQVHVRAGGVDRSWTAADASRQLGYDVKALGQDRGKLDAYVRASFS